MTAAADPFVKIAQISRLFDEWQEIDNRTRDYLNARQMLGWPLDTEYAAELAGECVRRKAAYFRAVAVPA